MSDVEELKRRRVEERKMDWMQLKYYAQHHDEGEEAQRVLKWIGEI